MKRFWFYNESGKDGFVIARSRSEAVRMLKDKYGAKTVKAPGFSVWGGEDSNSDADTQIVEFGKNK